VNNAEEMFNEMISYALKHPEKAPRRVLVVSLGKTNIERILTPARMEILRVIIRERPKTVGALVKNLKRPKESVSRDLRALADFGLLSLIKSGRKKAPTIEKDLIAMSLA